MWREQILDVMAEAELAGPATGEALAEVERVLEQPLPAALSSLLRECNGVRGPYGTDVVWSAERIAKENTSFRASADFATLYMPFEPLMFFGDNSGGDQFAFVRVPLRDDVFVWDHETDGRAMVANGLDDYLRRALEDSGDWWRD
ncbi:SMI1/KNR4 family protein [Streptomyces sp. SID8379]|uniref:SMI1/KNR4 family protein n=1 Tax=unclassified Streptomyces TaxID=2593676 RepID=UPI000371EAC6|nr:MULTISPECIES: SMI1/KNR4 family protein [unclassified Streptomyces]MYW70177.1 SMI1/KNR4 family protein [Streptomyces sp. SID8379]